MLRVSLAVAAALVVLVAGAAPADAATRSSAQRFADAALRMKIGLREIAPRFDAEMRELFRKCEPVLEPAKAPPAHARRRARVLVDSAGAEPFVALLGPVFATFLSDLHRIPTRDPALWSGRVAWRMRVAQFTGGPFIEGACDKLLAWAATGYARDAAPRFRVADYEHPDDEDVEMEIADRLERAAIRMVRRGVPEGDALRFMGHELFDALAVE